MAGTKVRFGSLSDRVAEKPLSQIGATTARVQFVALSQPELHPA
jgi:hypothetical protein